MSKIIQTQDGSHTLYSAQFDEHYHSTYGAIQESRHVYIEAGLKALPHEELSVLEIGFGTGLNAFLSFLEANASSQKLHYHALEKYPLSEAVFSQLNYAQSAEEKSLFTQLHLAKWQQSEKIGTHILLKEEADLCSYQFSQQYDLIYFDAFAPDKQPEMWSPQLLEKVTKSLKKQGILVTYSTKGLVKQAFRALGLEVKRLPGPPGKRDMLRCQKLSV